jgi:hypothetical protein
LLKLLFNILLEFDPRTPVKTITKSPDVKLHSGSKAKGILTKKFTPNSPVKQIILTPVKKDKEATNVNQVNNNITKTKIESKVTKTSKILPKKVWNSGNSKPLSKGPLATSNTKFTRGYKPMAGKVGNRYTDLNRTVRGRK